MPVGLGIDVGLSGARAAVMDAGGAVLASAREPLRPRFADGIAEADPADWVTGSLRAGAAAVRTAGVPVDGVAVTALGPAPVLVDEQGGALAPSPLFGLDRRADPWRERLGAGPDHVLPTLLRWHETEPSLMARAHVVLDAAGFVVHALTDVAVMDRITHALYRWTEDLAPPVAAPAPSEPDAVAGSLTEPSARTLGLRDGTPVAVGTTDCFADVAAAGVDHPGEGAILLGSTLIVYAVAAGAPTVPHLDTTPHLGDGSLVGGSTASAGLALDWVAHLLGGDHDVLATQAAELPPGAGGLLALPYLAGERTPILDPDARGVVAGLTLSTDRSQLYRAMVDGVAMTALDHTSRLEVARLGPTRYRVAGGGVRNDAWLVATCDAVGHPLEVMPDPGTAVGAAWLALRMLGEPPVREPGRTVTPDPERHEQYRQLLARSRELWVAAAPTVRHGVV
jgi:xylulokinase